MKRHRHANRVSSESPAPSPTVCLHAGGVWAKSAGHAAQTFPAAAGSDGRAWTRYIDSRLKQFGSR